MAAWSELPIDLWRTIGGKLEVTADRIRFRSVCPTWRSLVPFPQPPWLKLAEDDQAPHTRGFFSLTQHENHGEDQEVYQLQLPEIYQTRCLGSTGTWLITIDLQERIRLINPFSKIQIHLPSQETLEYGPIRDEIQTEAHILRDGFIWKVIISSPPPNRDWVAMALHHSHKRLAITRPGDTVWTTVQTPHPNFFVDAIFCRGQFYAINYYGELVVCDLDQTTPIATMLTTDRFRLKMDEHDVMYLAEWMGELLFIIKYLHDEDDWISYNTKAFQIYIFDFPNKKWNEHSTLGDYSLFLGLNTSVAVLASDYPGLKKNCIYFTDDYYFGYRGMELPGGRDMGVFDVEDKSIRLHYKGVSTSLYSPPIWIIP